MQYLFGEDADKIIEKAQIYLSNNERFNSNKSVELSWIANQFKTYRIHSITDHFRSALHSLFIHLQHQRVKLWQIFSPSLITLPAMQSLPQSHFVKKLQ